LVNYDGTPKQQASQKKATAKKVQIRWTPDMNAQLTSLVRIKKPYMKASTKEGRDDEKKAWRLMQSGLLSLPTFASGVSVEALKKKFWVLYTAFTIENNKLETATGNLPEEYGPFEQDMVHIKKEYELKRHER